MPHSSQFDVQWLDDLELPFDKTTKELSDKPRLVDGLNLYVTNGGKLAKRPGLTAVPKTGGTATTAAGYISRLWTFRDITSGTLWYVASVRNPSTSLFELHATNLTTNFTQITGSSTFNLEDALDSHEAAAYGGKLYVRYLITTAAAADKYGAVVIEENAGALRIVPWGAPAPTVPISVAVPGTPSSTSYEVFSAWRYTYAYEHISGHVGNRAPLVNPNTDVVVPNSAGPLTNQDISVTVTGHADTTNYPYIRIYRTTDGGGLYYFLDRIANPGNTTAIYNDDQRNPAAPGTPKEDGQLDTSEICPDEVINSMPPANDITLIDGVDATDEHSVVVKFARRLWYLVRNHLFFTGQEEIFNGIPQMAFPAPKGIFGNRYTISSKGTGLVPTINRLFVFTETEIYVVRGEDRTNLRLTNFSPDTGMHTSALFKTAAVAYRDAVFYLGRDNHVYAILGDNQPMPISLPLGDEIYNAITGVSLSAEARMTVYATGEHTWLILSIADELDPANNKQFVYDLKNERWFTPWDMPITAFTSGIGDFGNGEVLVTAHYDVDTNTSTLVYLDFEAEDDLNDSFAADGTTNLFPLPPGNHINALRAPGHHPMVSYMITERTKFAGDTDPVVQYRMDEFDSVAFSTPESVDPPFLAQRTSYNVNWYPIQLVGQRIQMKFTKAAASERFELQNIGFVFQSEAGV